MGTERALLARVDQNPEEFFDYVETLCRKYFARITVTVVAALPVDEWDALKAEMSKRGVLVETTFSVSQPGAELLRFKAENDMVPR